MVMSGGGIFQANSCSSMYSESYMGWRWRYYALGDFLMGSCLIGPLAIKEQTRKAVEYLSIIADPLHLYMSSVFLVGNVIFQQDNTPCSKVSKWFKNHNDEFRLKSWPLN
ncbi:transposable element Tcb2 transposase [Trichonephila clavipes]|nr:transposable element Tcb2 transposase [Trichonephila clavipes]